MEVDERPLLAAHCVIKTLCDCFSISMEGRLWPRLIDHLTDPKGPISLPAL